MAAERGLGHEPRDVSAEKKGWDIESRDRAAGHLRFIEVKGRHADGARRDPDQERDPGLAQRAGRFHPGALCGSTAGFAHEPVYVRRFFQRELGFAETAVVFDLMTCYPWA